jgi:leucine dehydrogenase
MALGNVGLAPIRIIGGADPVDEAMLLAKALTSKCAAADLNNFGAGVIIGGDPNTIKTGEIYAMFDEAVRIIEQREQMELKFGLDRGFGREDGAKAAEYIRGYDDVGHEETTADGIMNAMRAAMFNRIGYGRLSGAEFFPHDNGVMRVAVQGIGKVGKALCQRLRHRGVHLIVSDSNPENTDWAKRECNAEVVGVDEIYSVMAHIFAPCAGAGILNPQTAQSIKAGYICGSANAQVADPEAIKVLHERGTIYIPDFVVNAGGVIGALYHDDPEQCARHCEAIGERTFQLLRNAQSRHVMPVTVAQETVQKRFETAIPTQTTTQPSIN